MTEARESIDRSILIVDDDPDIRTALADFFEDEGYTVATAGNGRFALAYLRDHPTTTVVLLDLMMPIMDGIEFVAEQKRDPSIAMIPVVVMTAGRPEERELDVEAVLTKPLSLDKLCDTIQHVARAPSRPVTTPPPVRATRVAEPPVPQGQVASRLEQLERDMQLCEKCLAMLGHDLRNPLSVIVAGTGLLMRSNGSDDIARRVELIHNSAGRIQRIIDQFHDFTRVRLGKGIRLRPVSFDVEQVCRAAIRELETNGAKITCEVSGSTHATLDRERFAQLVSTLLAHALAHAGDDAQVTVRIDGNGSDKVQVEVIDPATIAADLLPVVFEPFRMVDDSTSVVLGIGLSVIRDIAHAHGGSIEVDSVDGRGTRFSVSLPRTVAE